MKKLVLLSAGTALLITAGCRDMTPAPDNATVTENVTRVSAADVQPVNPVVNDCNTTLPPADGKVTPAIANSGLPCSLGAAAPFNLPHLQEAFDFNSWLTFVALNQPAASGSTETKWEAWQDLFNLMLEDGSPPPPFGQSLPPPKVCTGATNSSTVMRMISKLPVTPTVQASNQPLNTGPLIDQNGHYVRYQILVNQPMYNYIVANNLYSKAGQQAFTGNVSFPVGDTTKDTTGTIGAMVAKAAWKVLDPKDPGDNPANFHTTKAFVYTPASDGVPESCSSQTLGLVGLHIVHKTKSEPQWIWSTFEHINNVPDQSEVAGLAPGAKFNFYKTGCNTTDCKVNAQPPQPWNPSQDPFPNGYHSQIVRTTVYEPIAVASAKLWNGQFRPALSGSVWANYELITTQWPRGTSKTDPDGAPFPKFAANSTMETYVQGNTPIASGSCMACHGNATTMAGRTSDFTFVLEKAH